MTDTSNYTWNYNDFDNYNEYNFDDYVFDHTNIFVLNRKKNAMELRHDLMAMYIYIVILFTFWLVNYFLEISSPEYRVYVNELAYNRFGMRIYDRVGIKTLTLNPRQKRRLQSLKMMILILNLTPKKKLILNQMKHQRRRF